MSSNFRRARQRVDRVRILVVGEKLHLGAQENRDAKVPVASVEMGGEVTITSVRRVDDDDDTRSCSPDVAEGLVRAATLLLL